MIAYNYDALSKQYVFICCMIHTLWPRPHMFWPRPHRKFLASASALASSFSGLINKPGDIACEVFKSRCGNGQCNAMVAVRPIRRNGVLSVHGTRRCCVAQWVIYWWQWALTTSFFSLVQHCCPSVSLYAHVYVTVHKRVICASCRCPAVHCLQTTLQVCVTEWPGHSATERVTRSSTVI